MTTLHQAFNECVELWRRGQLSDARALLANLSVNDLGPATSALRAKLESLLDVDGFAVVPVRLARPAVAAKPAQPARSSTLNGAATRLFTEDAAFEPSTVVQADHIPTKAGVSIVAGCMNRQRNLFRVLPSWLATQADEVVIVDWSSSEPLEPTLKALGDPRLKCMRIEGEPRWVASQAFNVAMRLARHERIYKLDCDIEVMPDFIEQNKFDQGEFVRGYWQLAVDAGETDQVFTHGNVAGMKSDLRGIGYYDERIVTYGWEDTDLYTRMAIDRGLAGKRLVFRSLRHVEQEAELRLVNQDVARGSFIGRYEPTEVEAAKNRYMTGMSPNWGAWFPPQDFTLECVSPNFMRGRRTTRQMTPIPEMVSIAKTLGARLLSIWVADTMPEMPYELLNRLDFARLMRDAHAQGIAEQFVLALHAGRGIHFLNVTDAALLPALHKTLRLITEHAPPVRERLLIVASAAPLEAESESPTSSPFHLPASPALIDLLARTCGATRQPDAMQLEDTLLAGVESCTITTFSFDSIAEEALRKAASFSTGLRARFVPSQAPLEGCAMVTSLYDEPNLIRLVEYLTCVVLNLRIFDNVVVCYESRDGTLHAILSRLVTRLELKLPRLVVLPFDLRPTFKQLFDVRQLFPDGTTVAVANADIAFDGTFGRLRDGDLSNMVTVLSRWDVIRGGADAALIRLGNGAPNTFSADAWIIRTPFEPDFHLDYPIGTIHCDSFINNQVGRSKRYRVTNPCLDVRVFHLHDERFNSSAEKQVRDKKEIEEKYAIEKERNGHLDPLRGVGWSAAANAVRLDAAANLQQWRPKAIVLDMSVSGAQLGGLLLLHLIRSFLKDARDVMIVACLSENDLHGTVANLLARYQAHFHADGMVLDMTDQPFDPIRGKEQAAFTRRMDAVDLIAALALDDSEAVLHRLVEHLRWPPGDKTALLRAEVDATMSSELVCTLVDAMRRRHPWVLDSLRGFIGSMDRWSAERLILQPFVADLAPPEEAARVSGRVVPRPRVSLVTSLFRGGEYLPGYLENVLVAAQRADGEVILVDANCDDSDAPVIRRFLQENPEAARRIDYVQLDKDPGLYNCWRIAIERARAPLVSNANLDDRRSPRHTERLASILEEHPEWAGSCGSISCVRVDGPGSWFSLTENEIWFWSEGSRVIGFDDLYLRDADGIIRSRSVMHCMPVWRKSLHERHGWFDEERYGTSADWAFWLKCARAGERYWFEEDQFGRYFMNPLSHNRRNDSSGAKELQIIEDFIGVKQTRAIKQ